MILAIARLTNLAEYLYISLNRHAPADCFLKILHKVCYCFFVLFQGTPFWINRISFFKRTLCTLVKNYYICRWEDRPRYNTKHPSLGMSYCPTCKSTPHSQWPVDMTTDEQLMWKQERIDMGFPYRTIWDAQFVYQWNPLLLSSYNLSIVCPHVCIHACRW